MYKRNLVCLERVIDKLSKLIDLEKNNTNINIKFFGINIKIKRKLFLALNNRIYISKNGNLKRVFRVKGLFINFLGTNSKIIVPAGEKFENCSIAINSNSELIIEDTYEHSIQNLFIENGINTKLHIGSNFSTIGTKIFNADKGSKLTIGNNCMFSNNTLLRTNDGHTIFDIQTKKAINKSKDVHIGNHVWLAKNATILKGVTLKDNIVVGSNSVVTRSFEESNIVLAGDPGKIVKTGINWSYYNYIAYKEKEEVKYG